MKKILSFLIGAFMLLAAGCSQAVNEPAVTVDESVTEKKPEVTEDKTAPTEDAMTAVNGSTSADVSVSAEKPVTTDSVITPSDGSVILPPARIGEDPYSVSLVRDYTFETAFSTAEAVARIKVGNWLSENNEIHSTYFEATVLQCFKGDIPETFILKQDGSSDGTIKNYPLFTYGNELLLFLKKGSTADYETVYWIIGAFTTVLDVSYSAEGARYYTDRRNIMGATMNISSNYVNQNNILSEVYASAVGSDPFIADITDKQHFYSHIFSEADVNKLIDNCKIS